MTIYCAEWTVPTPFKITLCLFQSSRIGQIPSSLTYTVQYLPHTFFYTGGSCSGYGDPHYVTFDNYPHTFMGNCTYTFTKLCEVNSGLPYFNVEVGHEYRGGNTRVSYVKEVTIYVHSYKIRLQKQKLVKVSRASTSFFIAFVNQMWDIFKVAKVVTKVCAHSGGELIKWSESFTVQPQVGAGL